MYLTESLSARISFRQTYSGQLKVKNGVHTCYGGFNMTVNLKACFV